MKKIILNLIQFHKLIYYKLKLKRKIFYNKVKKNYEKEIDEIWEREYSASMVSTHNEYILGYN